MQVNAHFRCYKRGKGFRKEVILRFITQEIRFELENKIKKKIGKAVAPLTVSVTNFGNFT